MIKLGDCLEGLRALPDNSVDSIVTDPPYGLKFMGKAWDYDVPPEEVWRECLRVLKPGGHLLCFAGTRTQHRMAVRIEDAGFEIRDTIMWVYGCLDEQTEVATIGGVMPYHKTKIGDLVLCYDAAQQTYSYQPILEIVEYEYSDTAYRLIGDFGEQVVSRNHRCIVERGGIEVFEHAEALQREARVPVLEDLPALQLALHDAYERAGCEKQGVQPGVLGGADRGEEYGRDAAGIPQGADCGLRSMREAGMETGCVAAQGGGANVQPQMQWSAARSAMGDTCAQGAVGMVGGIGSRPRGAHDWAEQSGVEGRSNVSQPEGSVCKSTNQARALPAGVPADGAQGWVCDGTPATGGASCWPCADASRSGTPCEPQCDGQPAAKPDAVRNERRAQGIRAWRGHKTAVVRVVPFQYTGKVWCLRVPTGAFVAVRNGVAFPTGNSGFPKSLDVSKAIDKAAGATREVVGTRVLSGRAAQSTKEKGGTYTAGAPSSAGLTKVEELTAPATDAARQWEGWGTALKPALEPITVARKPLVGTVAENVLAHGTGALNIDACRVGDFQNTTPSGVDRRNAKLAELGYRPGEYQMGEKVPNTPPGRWPANLILDGSDEVVALFPESNSSATPRNRKPKEDREHWRMGGGQYNDSTEYGDTGSAARFFYCAKASKADRDEGLDGLAERKAGSLNMRTDSHSERNGMTTAPRRNTHPTVKPTALMRYLCRLVTPPGGVVLDPYTGSGSTAKAAALEGFRFTGFEIDPDYHAIAERRWLAAIGELA